MLKIQNFILGVGAIPKLVISKVVITVLFIMEDI